MAIDQNTIARLGDELRRLTAERVEPTVPAVLYHYTSTQGLVSIFDTKKLFATHSQYCNDSSEVTYADTVANAVLDDMIKRARLDITVEFLERFRDMSSSSPFNLYVACFCEKDDLLNQWRVYTAKDGYAIGFDGASLTNLFSLTLCQIVYQPEQQRAMLEQVLGPIVALLDRDLDGFDRQEQKDRNALETVYTLLYLHLLNVFIRFKNPAFEVEHEWRLVYQVNGQPPELGYRAAAYGLTPYVPLDVTKDGLLPIRSVRHGPCTNPEGAKRALQGFLELKKYYGVAVTGTNLPVRL